MYRRTCLIHSENCARDGNKKDFRGSVKDGLDSVLSHCSTQLMQPLKFPFLESFPVGIATCFIFEVQVFEIIRVFEDHWYHIILYTSVPSFRGNA